MSPQPPPTTWPPNGGVWESWSPSGHTGAWPGGSPARTSRGPPTANLASSVGRTPHEGAGTLLTRPLSQGPPHSGRAPGETFEQGEGERHFPATAEKGSHGFRAWGMFQLPGKRFHRLSPAIWAVPTHTRWCSLPKTSLPGSETRSNCVWQTHAPSYAPVTHNRLLSALKTQTRKEGKRAALPSTLLAQEKSWWLCKSRKCSGKWAHRLAGAASRCSAGAEDGDR